MLDKHNFKYLALIAGFVLMGLLSTFSTSFAQGDTWTSKSSMPTARHGCACCVLDGKIYVMGGTTPASYPNAVKTVEIFDPKANSWTVGQELLVARYLASASAVNGKIYVIGGKPGDVSGGHKADVHEFDPVTQSWSIKAPMQNPRAALATCVVDNKIYAIGGSASAGLLDAVEAYEATTNTWTTKKAMPTPRGFHAAAVVNGKIYVLGGGFSNPIATVEEYDPLTDTWTRKKDMPTARLGLVAEAAKGKIYAMGGTTSYSTPQPILKVNEEYDPTADTWVTRAELLTPKCEFSSSFVDDKIYVIGGISNIASDWTLSISASVEEYTPPAGTSVANMNLNLPVDFQLEQNYPNPFNPTTTISYSLAKDSHVRLTVYNSLGQVVAVLVDGYQAKGSYSVNWEAHHQPSGIYLCQLKAGEFSVARKMFLQK